MHFLNITDEMFEIYLRRLHAKYQGPVINWGEVDPRHRYQQPYYTDESSVKPEAHRILMHSNDHYNIVNKNLSTFNRKPLAVPLDGDCLFSSILEQVHYDKNLYNA